MKAIITNDLKNRVICAAANGSVIAQDLLAAIRRNRDISEETNMTINYFDSKRRVQTLDGRKSIRVVVTCCRKDVTNREFPDYGNPQAPYFPENRQEITVKDFAEVFKDVREKEYDDTDWTYFDSAMRLASKVRFRVGTTIADFIKAYTETNYIAMSESNESTLNGSCMRHEDKVRNAADYYVNFAGAKILIGETQDGDVVSRAILWDDIHVLHLKETISFIDRIYTAFDGFLLTAMRRAAIRFGYLWGKTHNDYCHKTTFRPAVTVTLHNGQDAECVFEVGENYHLDVYKQVPSLKLHKHGCPYCDTMSYLMYDSDSFTFTISNNDNIGSIGNKVADLTNTSAFGSRYSYICPVCGKRHADGEDMCDSCIGKVYDETLFGRVMKGKTAIYKHKTVSSLLLQGGKPTPAFGAYITLSRICKPNFNI